MLVRHRHRFCWPVSSPGRGRCLAAQRSRLRRKSFSFSATRGIATTKEHHVSLRRELPNLRSITVFGFGGSGWQARHTNWIRYGHSRSEESRSSVGCDRPGRCLRLSALLAVRTHVLQQLRKTPEALDTFDRAIGLTEDPAVRQFLLQRRG